MGKRGPKPFLNEEDSDDKRWPRPWMGPFLDKLVEMPNVTRACRLTQVASSIAYYWREKSKRFAKAWDESVEAGIENLEEVVWNRATSPSSPSDLLAIFLLKAHRPEKYRETRRVEVGGVENQPVQVEVRAVDYRIAVAPLAPSELIEDADYRLLSAPVSDVENP